MNIAEAATLILDDGLNEVLNKSFENMDIIDKYAEERGAADLQISVGTAALFMDLLSMLDDIYAKAERQRPIKLLECYLSLLMFQINSLHKCGVSHDRLKKELTEKWGADFVEDLFASALAP